MAVRRWEMPSASDEDIRRLSLETGQPPLLCSVLLSRGITGGEEAEDFLSDNTPLASPYEIKDMDLAVERVRAALEDGERIAVYGDYDCDGITSTALLTGYLQSVGADVIYYLPDREKEGYGLNRGAVDILLGQGTGLIITVDNGISAHEEIDYANSLGIDVVVTDHHTPRETLPNAIAVVNPHRLDCPSRYKELTGVGVAFKLVCALEDAPCEELLEYYSEIAAIGTIADVAPITGENRAIVKHGLSRMKDTGSPGLRALIEVSGLGTREITGESAAFGMIPRINASGRMGVADDAVELLLTDDNEYAAELAEKMDALNTARKKIEDEILTDIERQISADPSVLNRRLLILWGNGWHHGVIGIAASKLMEKYAKPVILLSVENGVARGSGRSIEGFSLIKAVSACSGRLIRYGGHTLAAGMTINSADLPGFAGEMEAYALENYPDMPVASLKADYTLSPEELTIECVSGFSVLEPFGAGNEPPVFLMKNLKVMGVYPTSNGRHVRVRLDFGGHNFYAVYFGVTEKELPCTAGDSVDMLAVLSVSDYNGERRLSVRIKDIRPAGVDQEELICSHNRYLRHIRGEYEGVSKAGIMPDRDEIAIVYKYIKKSGALSSWYENMYYRLMDGGIDFCKMRVAADVLMELKLAAANGGGGISIVPDADRVDLSNSAILANLMG